MIARWDVITIGNLSRNRYWGENEETPVRPVLCTCTLLQGEGFHLLVDPSCAEESRMAAELDRRTGLRLADVDAVFLTHEHSDHHYGLRHFPGARWLAAEGVARAINAEGGYDRPVEAASAILYDCVAVVPTPGHTPGHSSLAFECDAYSVLVAGDAVMTKDFWRERRPYFNAVDAELAAATMNQIATIAEVVVPGHDNYLLVEEEELALEARG